MSDLVSLKQEILRLTRTYAQEAHRAFRPGNDPDRRPYEAGEAIPEWFRIAIVDQNDVDIVITLLKIESDELSDADLEQVAGGKDGHRSRGGWSRTWSYFKDA